ncbi:MAG: cytochrome C [Alcanivorax sp.]|nr:cytochrome C [Alcanivorax sp.]MAY12050.1 cytochrome C [Alcanivorax sp.]MBI56092.1 cytochrome C [Alcanivorax sp.]MBU57814.1 cytochrome C [Alcanivorax sp.]UWN51960.1 Ferrous iron permease EfeU [Alcanivorax sp. ALC70]|tara:strand:+ start:2653 stop:4584 length:1932 start_codon:yes stop_codon:yes gene_type:complete
MTHLKRRPRGVFLLLSLFALSLSALTATARAADQTALVQLVEYVGADYINAVQDGEIVSDAEYAEMDEFTALLSEGIEGLPQAEGKDVLLGQARDLEAAVDDKAPEARIQGLAQKIRGSLVDVYGLPVVPKAAPDMAAAEQLYQTHCVACHGPEGRGDGPAGAALEPAPTDFHERARYMGRSVLGLYTTITGGVEGTGMAGYQEQLSDAERWALAFYVGSKAVPADEAEAGKQALAGNQELKTDMTLDTVIAKAPADARDAYGDDALAAMGYLRSEPGALFSQNRFVEISAAKLAEADQAYAAGDRAAARSAALSAYLDGFEMLESQISAIDRELMRSTERQFMAVREAIQESAPAEEVSERVAEAQAGLNQAADALGGDGLSATATFSASFFILFREGLEALLIVAALLTFTRKAGATSATRHIHLGWVVAILAGVATWFAASTVINFSGASRELTEGIAGLVAAAILFYVGFWMHSNSNSQKWLGYLKGKVDTALGSGTIWTLTFVAFISVYREMFETILFYQALWTQVTEATQPFLLYGMGAALVALAVVCVLIFRLGMKLPLGLFFKATSLVLLVLSVILLGKGIAALQEAGLLNANYLPGWPTVEWVGFFPTLQGALAQAVAVVLAVLAWWRSGRSAA